MDVDGDGKINANDPREFSFYHHGKAKRSGKRCFVVLVL